MQKIPDISINYINHKRVSRKDMSRVFKVKKSNILSKKFKQQPEGKKRRKRNESST
jgi:hypothetical protein